MDVTVFTFKSSIEGAWNNFTHLSDEPFGFDFADRVFVGQLVVVWIKPNKNVSDPIFDMYTSALMTTMVFRWNYHVHSRCFMFRAVPGLQVVFYQRSISANNWMAVANGTKCCLYTLKDEQGPAFGMPTESYICYPYLVIPYQRNVPTQILLTEFRPGRKANRQNYYYIAPRLIYMRLFKSLTMFWCRDVDYLKVANDVAGRIIEATAEIFQQTDFAIVSLPCSLALGPAAIQDEISKPERRSRKRKQVFQSFGVIRLVRTPEPQPENSDDWFQQVLWP